MATTTHHNSNRNLTEVPAEWFEVHFQNAEGVEMMVLTEHSEQRLRERFIGDGDYRTWVWFITRCHLEYQGNRYRIASNMIDGGTAHPEVGRL